MKVLVVGATGYVGGVLVRQLADRRHQVVALVRGERDLPEGTEARGADLSDPGSLDGIVTADIDAVVHAATPGANWDVEIAAVTNLVEQLHGKSRAFVYISGVWVLGASAPHEQIGFDEHSRLQPIELVARRGELEDLVLSNIGVRGIVVRPGIVYGHGKGIPSMMLGWAKENAVGTFVGSDVDITWPVVHVEDLAKLIVSALESSDARGIFHAIADPALPVHDLAVAADLAAGGLGRAKLWEVAEAAVVLGEGFAEALALNQVAYSTRSGELDWVPTQPTIIEDVRSSSYRVVDHRA